MGSIPRSGISPEKETVPHTGILAWEIPWTGEPGRLQSTGSKRVRPGWSYLALIQHTQRSIIRIYHIFFIHPSGFICLFLAALGLRCCVQAFSGCSRWGLLPSCGVWTSHRGGFSCWGAQASSWWFLLLRSTGFSAHAFSSRGALAYPPRSIWNLPRPGREPALAGGLLTTGPPWRSYSSISWWTFELFTPSEYCK